MLFCWLVSYILKFSLVSVSSFWSDLWKFGVISLTVKHWHTALCTFMHWDMFDFKQEKLPSDDSRKAGSDATYIVSWIYTYIFIWLWCEHVSLLSLSLKGARSLIQEWGPKHQGWGTSFGDGYFIVFLPYNCVWLQHITMYVWKIKWFGCRVLMCPLIGPFLNGLRRFDNRLCRLYTASSSTWITWFWRHF
jgi:hypothetical protein